MTATTRPPTSAARPVGTKRQRTRARLTECALELFESQGYEETTVAQIAAAAGVTEMTFFRHYPAKHQVLLDDPYDPAIAAGIAAESTELDPLARVVAGVRKTWAAMPELDTTLVSRRIAIAAATPSLRGRVWDNTAETERVIADQLIGDGTDPLTARSVAAASVAALMAGLFEWSRRDDLTLGEAMNAALDAISPDRG